MADTSNVHSTRPPAIPQLRRRGVSTARQFSLIRYPVSTARSPTEQTGTCAGRPAPGLHGAATFGQIVVSPNVLAVRRAPDRCRAPQSRDSWGSGAGGAAGEKYTTLLAQSPVLGCCRPRSQPALHRCFMRWSLRAIAPGTSARVVTSKSWALPAGLPRLKRWPVAGQSWDRSGQARRGNACDSRPIFLGGKASCDRCIKLRRNA